MRILLAPLLLAASLPAFAEVDSKIHKLCIEAKDYAGCVRAMKGETIPTSRQINSQGADIAEGNTCPAGYAYVGGGNCQNVICVEGRFTGWKNDERLAGKGWECGKIMGVFRLSMTVGNMVLRTSTNSKCPLGEPENGYNSTCQKPPSGWESPAAKAAREEKEGPKCNFKLKAYSCSYNTYLEANPSMKKWAELNPDMAAKERVKLQSVD